MEGVSTHTNNINMSSISHITMHVITHMINVIAWNNATVVTNLKTYSLAQSPMSIISINITMHASISSLRQQQHPNVISSRARDRVHVIIIVAFFGSSFCFKERLL